MSASENKAQAEAAYKAFAAGDLDNVMSNMADDIEWIVPGDSGISGTYRGKDEVAGYFRTIAGKSFRTEPQQFIAEGDHVAVLTRITVDGQSADQVDVVTFRSDGKVARFQPFGDTALQERVWGRK
jgi:ketosteroid isomerase-like protein